MSERVVREDIDLVAIVAADDFDTIDHNALTDKGEVVAKYKPNSDDDMTYIEIRRDSDGQFYVNVDGIYGPESIKISDNDYVAEALKKEGVEL